jgi:hypothetical protein
MGALFCRMILLRWEHFRCCGKRNKGLYLDHQTRENEGKHVITYQVSIRKGEEAPRTFGFNDTRRAQAFAAKMTAEGFRVAIVTRQTVEVLREAFPEKFV